MGVSVFRRVNKHSYKDLLAYFPDSFHELENVIYTVEAPKVLSASKKNLLVLFSYTNKSNENMVDRYYSHPFPFISNSIMPNTYIIRMADVSDAFGSHGLNTKFDENIEDNIQRFIKSLMSIYGIDKKKRSHLRCIIRRYRSGISRLNWWVQNLCNRPIFGQP